MDRSQQKCLFASAGGHVTLFLIFVFGSAFLISKPPVDDLPTVHVYPTAFVDALVAGGGGNPDKPQTDAVPGGAPPPPIPLTPSDPQPPVPEPIVQKVVDPPPAPPETPKKEDKPPTPEKPISPPRQTPAKRPDPKTTLKDTPKKPKDPVERPVTDPPKTKQTPQQIEIDPTKTVVRNNEDTKRRARQKAQEDADLKARQEAYERTKAATDARRRAFQESLASLGTGFSKDKGVAVEVGGPGGEAYANYGSFVKQAYDSAWIVASSLGDDDVTAEVTVVVLKSGEIASARISRRSSLPALDKTIETAL
ncbi:MAG: TonB C-terminal domain-containing protein, partial [Verrucomicrobia bacterium]|nr:TonB C-terminal domain-containing protein [Verrucomicrobiota bacterium]